MDKIKKLEEKLKTVSGEEKVEKLNDLAFALYNSEPEKTEQYANQVLALAEKLDSAKGISRSYNIIGISYHVRGNYEKAMAFYLKALKIYEKIGDNNRIAVSKNNIGAIYEKQGNYDLALKFYFDALKIWEEMDDKKNLSAAYNNVGIIYQKQESYDSSLEYYLKSLKIKEEIEDNSGAAISYNNIGIIYQIQGSFDRALEYYLKALKIKEEIGDKQTIAVSYINIGSIYGDQNDDDKAIEYYLKAFKIFEDIADKYGITTSCTSLGIIYTKLQNYNLAHKYLKKSLQLAHKIGAKELEISAIDALSGLYEAQADFKQALQYHKKYTFLEKEVFNEQKSKQIAEMQAKYETEKKEKEAEIFRLKNVELAKANEQLTKEIAERKKAEKEILIGRKRLKIVNSILRHDLTNDFAVIKSALRLYKVNSETKMLDEIDKRVENGLNMIHRQQKQESFIKTHSYLDEYKIEDVINQTVKKYSDIESKVSGSGIVFADESIYSVFENLISNAINHGNSTKLNIEINSKEDYCEIKFMDNGMGIPDKIKDRVFDEGFSHGKAGNTGIGLFIVKQTIEEYDGTVSVEDNKPKGTIFVISLKNIIRK